MTKKARRKALAMAIAAKGSAGELFVIDASGLKPAKTKELIELLWSPTPDAKTKSAKPKRTRAKSKAGAEQADAVDAERPAAAAGRAKTDRVLFVVDRARDEGARETALSGR